MAGDPAAPAPPDTGASVPGSPESTSPATDRPLTTTVVKRPVRWWAPTVIFGAITLLMLNIQHLSAHVLRSGAGRWSTSVNPSSYVDGWVQFDGNEYRRIAAGGYSYTPGERSNIVWFPLYPNLMRVVRPLIGNWNVTGLIVAGLAGLAATLLYWHWLDAVAVPRERKWAAFMFLMLYPYGWYLYGVLHSDALFLALVVAAFLLIEKDRYVWAGVVGALATATRPTGLAVIPGLFVHGLVHAGVLTHVGRKWIWVRRFRFPNRVDRSKWSPKLLAPLLALTGVGSYAVYLWIRFGEPLAFATNQDTYHREPGLYNLVKYYYFATVTDWSDALHPLTMTGQALVLVTVLVSVPLVGRRFGWGYAAFVGTLGMIPVFSSEDFMGVGRYMMAAFPTMALMGEWLAAPEHRRQRIAWFTTATGLLLVMVWGFSRSWYFT